MRRIVPNRTAHPYRFWLALVCCSLALLVLAFVASRLVGRHRLVQRGVLHEALPPLSLPTDNRYGVNVSLQQYVSDAELRQVLGLVRASGFGWLRQHFPWADIEPQPGAFDWSPWDRLVAEVRRQGLELIAVLDTAPAWAQCPVDRSNRYAPPQYVSTYGLFARAFAQRYAGQITCYEIWDQPNIYPHWGERPIDPAAYVRLLEVAAREVEAADADAIVLSAGLAPNTEAGGRNMAELPYLRGMYDAGARGLFDVLSAKPYGFWSGPEDRRVDVQVLNFSRLILLREEMVRRGDGAVPVWAVEFGWNALPQGWEGAAPPWGTDSIDKQSDRIVRAIERARQEWSWLGVLCWADLQPPLPEDDPRWGFALLDRELEATGLYRALQAAISGPVGAVAEDGSLYRLQLALLGAAVLLTLMIWGLLARQVPWRAWAAHLLARYAASPEWAQWTLLGGLLAAYYWLPWPVLNVLALACAGALVYVRLDIGLGYLVLSIPFFLFPKYILGKAFSVVEVLTLVCTAAWLVRCLCGEVWRGDFRSAASRWRRWCAVCMASLSSLDWAVVAFVLLSALLIPFSVNRGVHIREFRVIILEPALFYFVLRGSQLDEEQRMRLADALLLAGLAVCAVGLYQYVVRADVIVAEGVRRMRGVYASPNNLSLMLGRVIALALAVLWMGRGRRRWVYGLALIPLLLCLFLTYSRGGWLLSLPAALLAIGLMRGRRATLLALAAVVLVGVLLFPVLGSERILSLFDFEQGTTFYRLKLWQAAVAMIRDHPLTGVGLDNFLYRYPEYMLPEAWQEPGLSHPHNIILDYWTRLGIGGVAILVWLQLEFFRLAVRLYRRLPEGNPRAIITGLIAGMAATLAHGLIDNSYFLVDLAFIFFLCMGIVRAMAAECVGGQQAKAS
jgi:O-antigen ligase